MAFRYTGFADEVSNELDKQIEVTQRAGWSSIELRKVGDKNVCALEPDEWKAAWETLNAAGITVAGFGSAIGNPSRRVDCDFQLDVDDLKRSIPYMKQAGTDLIRVMSFPNARENPWEKTEWKHEVFRRLKELAVIAQANDIILGHENCSGYAGHDADAFLEIIAAVDSPNLKLIFDTGNCTGKADGTEATWAYYEACRPHIAHVHIKCKKPNQEGGWRTCFPDEDPVQARIIQDLHATGYDGWLSIEPHMMVSLETCDERAAVYEDYTTRLESVVASIQGQ